MTAMTGGCQCGRIRYSAEIDSNEAYLCHCKMCRRATGGASIAFVNVPLAGLRWESAPEWYRSSPIAHRPFCASCGTPLGFAFLEAGDSIDITLGSFDAPERFRPTHNYAVESLLPAWLDCSGLPAQTTDQNPNVVQRWKDAVGHLPE